MKHEELKQALTRLHAELEGGAPVDPELRQLLKTLDADIHRTLQQRPALESPSPHPAVTEPTADAADGELGERARDVSARFAAEHPYLDNALRNLIDALAKMGI